MANSADQMFAKDMIEHHKMAVEMSKKFSGEGEDPKLLFLAKNVIKAQTEEIDFLEGWLRKNKKEM